MQKLVKGRNNMGKFGNNKNQVLSFLNLNKIFIASKALNFSNILTKSEISGHGGLWVWERNSKGVLATQRALKLLCYFEYLAEF